MSTNLETSELSYPLRAAARLTGLSPALLRSWERRHGVVDPARTTGGTRRYSATDIERLRLLKSAVDAGHRIGNVAPLTTDELRQKLAESGTPIAIDRLDDVLSALDRLDGVEAQRQLSMHLSTLGPASFARHFALPLVREIGQRWAGGTMGIAAEHLATGVLRTLLGSGFQPTAASVRGPRVVFATPTGERHEIGLLAAALTAVGAGANPLYLGTELPVDDLLSTMEITGAAVLALGLVSLPASQAERTISALRGGLPGTVHIWIGGSGAQNFPELAGVEVIRDLDNLESRIALLSLEGPSTNRSGP